MSTSFTTLLISGSHFDSKSGVKKKVQNDSFFGVKFTPGGVKVKMHTKIEYNFNPTFGVDLTPLFLLSSKELFQLPQWS